MLSRKPAARWIFNSPVLQNQPSRFSGIPQSTLDFRFSVQVAFGYLDSVPSVADRGVPTHLSP
jgi:hypothetical protein